MEQQPMATQEQIHQLTMQTLQVMQNEFKKGLAQGMVRFQKPEDQTTLIETYMEGLMSLNVTMLTMFGGVSKEHQHQMSMIFNSKFDYCREEKEKQERIKKLSEGINGRHQK